MTAVTDNLLCLISFISIRVMILIADSGATKTDWCLGTSDTECRWIQTEGISPFHQSEETIRNIIQSQLLPSLSSVLTQIHSIFFYGAGCTPSLAGIVRQALSTYFPSQTIAVETDLLGAARALCKDQAGIACILGTGSNSCLYDGSQITHNVSPLGYILGDEGSGAYLGKRFIGDCLKKQLPSFICDGLFEELKLTVPELLDKVYRQPQANRFLAGIAPYIHRNKISARSTSLSSRLLPCLFPTQCFSLRSLASGIIYRLRRMVLSRRHQSDRFPSWIYHRTVHQEPHPRPDKLSSQILTI